MCVGSHAIINVDACSMHVRSVRSTNIDYLVPPPPFFYLAIVLCVAGIKLGHAIKIVEYMRVQEENQQGGHTKSHPLVLTGKAPKM